MEWHCLNLLIIRHLFSIIRRVAGRKAYRSGSLVLILIFAFSTVFGQKQSNFWYFGKKAGLDFTNFDPMPLNNSQMDTPDGVASISDNTGKLLFYTNGVSIWNSNHEKVNTNPLIGDSTATQSASIVPDPDVPGQYFVITTRSFNADSLSNPGLFIYTIQIGSGNANTLSSPKVMVPNTSEKIAVIPYTYIDNATNKTGYWVITPEFKTNRLIKIKYDGQWHQPDFQPISSHIQGDTTDYGKLRSEPGQMKVNDLGDRLALASEGGKFFEILSFSTTSGLISNSMIIPAGNLDNKFAFKYAAYGVEFSPTGRYGFEPTSGNFLYGAARDSGYIYQWDMSFYSSQSDRNSFLKSCKVLSSDPDLLSGSLQIAPNGKIYIAYKNQDLIGVISSPMRPFPGCNFEQNGARLIDNDTGLGGLSGFGLPSPIPLQKAQEPFYFENLCLGDVTLFYITDQTSITANTPRAWVFSKLPSGQTVTKTSQTNEFKYTFLTPGSYRVRLTVFKNGVPVTYSRDLTINPIPVVKLSQKDTVMLCRGFSLDLDAGSGAFYEWENTEIKVRKRTITTDTLLELNLYRVKVTDYHGCVGWDTVWVRRMVPPIIDTTYSMSAFCRNMDGSATIIPAGSMAKYSFTWEGYPNAKTNTLSGINGGDYVVHTLSKYSPCEAIDTIHVPQIGGKNVKMVSLGDSIVCPGNPMTLKVMGANQVNWINPPGNTDFEVVVNPTEKTVYKATAITIDAGRSCPTEVTFTMDVYATKAPKLGNDTTACEGQIVKIKPDSWYSSYRWSNGQVDSIAKIRTNTSALTLTATDKHGCVTTSDPVAINFKTSPPINLGPDTAYCSKDPIQLHGGTGDSYLWNNGLGTASTFYAPRTGDYWLAITRGKCTSYDTVHIKINDPTALKINSVSPKDITCYGGTNGSISIDAKGEGQHIDYSIDGGSTYFGNGGLFEGLPLGSNYRIKIREDSLCYSTWDQPVSISQPDQLVLKACYEAPSAQGSKDGSITLVSSGGIGPYEIMLDGRKLTSTSITNLDSGTYSFTMTDKNKCQIVKTVALELGTRLKLEANHPIICPGYSVDLTVTNGVAIEWIGLPGRTGSKITEAPLVTTDYWVKSTRTTEDGSICESIDSVRVYVTPDYTVSLGPVKDNTCFVTSDVLPNGSVEILTNPSGAYEYSMDLGATWQSSPEFKNLYPGSDYHFQVRDNNKCIKILSDVATINQPDSIHVKYRVKSPSCNTCSDGQLIIKSITGGTPDYSISLDGKGVGTTVTNLAEGKYQLTVTDRNSCVRTMEIPVDMLNYIPNVITPNNDQVNDTWKIPLLIGNPDCSVSVYDLNRQLVFTSQGEYNPWNGYATSGRYNGSLVPAGTYYYIIDTKDGDPIFTGSLTVIR